MTVKEALNQVGAMDDDGEGINIQNISPGRAAILVPKLIKAMSMFESHSAELTKSAVYCTLLHIPLDTNHKENN